MKTSNYKVIAFEHSCAGHTDYYVGEGVSFSDSVSKAIKVAKDKAELDLISKESGSAVSILAHYEVYKNNRKILDVQY